MTPSALSNETPKPCPFCGDPMRVHHDTLKHVEQGTCPIGAYAWGGSAAVEAWNQRSPLITELLSHRSEGAGYVFLNPDTGVEYSLNHPVESGECEDAQDIRPSTDFEDHLAAELHAARTTIGSLQEGLNSASKDYQSAWNRAEKAEAALSPSTERAETIEPDVFSVAIPSLPDDQPAFITRDDAIANLESLLTQGWDVATEAAIAVAIRALNPSGSGERG